MLPVPVIRPQTAYNCGTYSLWMALESLQGRNDGLIRKIEDKAKMYSDSMGGIFNYVHMERIIQQLNFNCKKVQFHDQQSFNNALQNHPGSAILIAYSFSLLFPLAVGGDPGDLAHWSLLTGLNGANATIANPHGEAQQFPVALLLQANLALKTGTFNWKVFVENNQDDPLFQQELKKYKNDISELNKRGRSSIYLGGYFIAIQ